MSDLNGFKDIPGYDGYMVNLKGTVYSKESKSVVKPYLCNGYKTLSISCNGERTTLAVHRAIALAWIPNDNPDVNIIINHIDGNPLNNSIDNLEWCTYSDNNYHAINTGLRNDNMPCKLRSIFTKEVHHFSSITQAMKFMGFNNTKPKGILKPKQFGKLLKDIYEFRYEDDPEPWFYENRDKPVGPSRYLITVKDEAGNLVEEYFGTRGFIKNYGLYRSNGKNAPALVDYANEIHKSLVFSYQDSYSEYEAYHVKDDRPTRKKVLVYAVNDETIIVKRSLTQMAKHFNVDRSTIQNRLDNDLDLNGWLFYTSMPA